MEPMAVRSECRGRKRRRKYVQNGTNDHPLVPSPKKRGVDIRGKALVGRYVFKEFDGDGVFLGKIVFYDSGLYRVDYEDGDCEDLDSGEIRQLLIEDEFFDDELIERRKILDVSLSRNERKLGFQSDKKDERAANNENEQVELPMVNELPIVNEVPSTEVDDIEVDDDIDSSDDLCEYHQDSDMGSGTEVPGIPPPPELPPSSGTIGVPEEYVPNLFSVYGFLRSFSVRLFLSPFTLNDLVGCLNCNVPNTLLNAIHVALLREARRRLETSSFDGSELASKCLRCIDWKLLDILTWPVYLANYLLVMGYLNGDFWKGFLIDALEKDYFTLSVERKLTVLQILCDDALDSAEIRAEVDFREQSEIGEDPDMIMVLPDSGLRKLHPLSAKPSDDNDGVSGAAAADYGDGNGDECRLCGMDGTLLCCDGCPSAYHSRCIGVGKVSIPEGPWYCPECTISKVEPLLTVGTSLRGAEIFGIDLYDQLFLGTCNHLVVLKDSVSISPIVKYYNSDDIPRVLSTINSSTHHAVLYSGICRAILKYWEMPEQMILLSESIQADIGLENQKEEFCLPTASHPFYEGGSVKAFDTGEVEKHANESGCLVDNLAGLVNNNSYKQPGLGKVSLGEAKQMELAIVAGCSDTAVKENGKYAMASVADCVKTDNTVPCASASQQAHLSGSTQLGVADRLCITASGTYTSQYKKNTGGPQNGAVFPLNFSNVRNEGNNGVVGVGSQKVRGNCLCMGSTFKPQTYINNYVQGDFAASAAANLAILMSEEQRASDVHLSDPRKAMSVNASLQVKAFSSAASRFFWPNTEKKLIEVPRERCGWCLSCKAPASSKKACLLNAAALNATRAAMKAILGIRLAKNIDGSLYSIAIYMLYMEESLHGLVVGPFLDETYRLQWRKWVEQASSCNEMKFLLLELEKNLCSIALSGDWFSLVNNWMDESSAVQSTCLVGSIQKRGPGRRGRKPLNASEVSAGDSFDHLNGFSWWREGRMSKLLFQKRMLPFSVLRKAARQGGSRRISGIYYAEGSDIPKRSRQVIWRASVDLSKDAARLALQVRYLDVHIKWSDLVRPDQIIQDGKGAETDVSFFRNASIFDKKVVEDKIMYAVAFGCQKHLPSRIVKGIIEKEETPDGNDKLWFSETRVPLYLVKEYEVKADKTIVVPAERPSNKLSELQKRQLKASRKDIFKFLVLRRENLKTCSCASCHVDVLIDSAVKCNACEGYCHEHCTVSATVQTNDNVRTCNTCLSGRAVTQKITKVESPTSPLPLQGQEYQGALSAAKRLSQKASQGPESRSAPPASRSTRLKALQGKECQSILPASKSAKKKTNHKILPSAVPMESCSDRKLDVSDSRLAAKSQKRLCNWGLIWRKKNVEDTGPEFRCNHLILRENPDNRNVSGVVCHLCHKGYDSHLMFIRCHTCSAWYHSDALELDESKLPDLQGFKCCKCRRIRSPVCPYTDPDRLKAAEAKKPRPKTLKQGKIEADSVYTAISDQTESSLPTTPIYPLEEDVFVQVNDPEYLKPAEAKKPRPEIWKQGQVKTNSVYATISAQTESSLPTSPISPVDEDVFVQVNDPLLFSASNVEPIPEPKAEADYEWSTPSGLWPHKLPVRRHLKNEDNDGFTGNNFSPAELPAEFKSDTLSYPMDKLSSPHVEWDVSNCGLEDGVACEYEGFNYLDTDYEPQTYFSFTELLASDDGQLDGTDVSGSIPGTLENWTCANSQSGVLEHSEMGFVGDQSEPMTYTETAAAIPCRKCSQIDPVPDLCCQNCGLHIHNHCSPWEELPQEESWRCGNCRL